MARAFTVVELLVVVAIIAVLAAVLFPTIAAAKRHAREPDEIARLRQVYLGLVMYEDDDSEMPSVLPLARPYVGDVRVFATAYPGLVRRPAHAPYPPEMFTHFADGESSFPVDFGYLKTYPPNDENKARWRLKRADPLCGLIASPWAGAPFTLSPANEDTLMDGPVLRIKMDGSLYRLAQNPYAGGFGDVRGLFYYPLVKDFFGP